MKILGSHKISRSRRKSAMGSKASPERRRRYYKGRAAELFAALLLMAKGYRILQWRARSPSGEVDLIALRGRRLAFVEVKFRRSIEAAKAAISPHQQKRLMRTAENWAGRRPGYRDFEIGMDALFIAPWHWPRHEVNVFYRL